MINQRTLDFLEHYGVKGQKWGVITKGKRSSGTPSERVVKSKAKSLSNDELKKHIERMQLEQRYSELSRPGKQAGKRYAQDLLKQSGSKLVGAVVATAATLAVTAAFGAHTAKSQGRQEALKERAKAEEAAKFKPATT